MVSQSRIKYRSTLKSNLVHLPLSLYAPAVQQQLRPQSLIIHLRHVKSTISTSRPPAAQAHLGWSGLASASSLEQYGLASGSRSTSLETVEIDPGVCLDLGWIEGDIVEISTISSPPKARSLSVTPISSDDWEVLELNANYLESNLLSQLRAGTTGQVISVWVLGKHRIRVKIDETNPPTTAGQTAVLLTVDTEIFVAPRPRNLPTSRKPNGVAESAKPVSVTKKDSPTITSSLKQATMQPDVIDPLTNGMSMTGRSKPSLALGIVPERVWTRWNDVKLAVGSAMKPAQEDTAPASPIACVSLRMARDIAGVAEAGAETWVRYKPVDSKKSDDSAATDEANIDTGPAPATKTLDPSRRLVGMRGIPDGHVILWPPLEKEDKSEIARSRWSRGDFEVVMPPKSRSRRSQGALPTDPADLLAGDETALAGVEDIIKDSCSYFARRVGALQAYSRRTAVPALLVTGASGNGKTTVAKAIASRMEQSRDLLASVIYVDCKTESEKGSLSATRELIRGWFASAQAQSPCTLVLDGLDAVINGEAEHVDNSQARTVAEYFASCIAGAESGVPHPSECYIVATANSEKDLHPVIKIRRTFGKTVQLTPPGQDVRKQILATALKNKLAALRLPPVSTSSIDFTTVANMTEGYSTSDLQDLVDKSLQGWLIRQASTSSADQIEMRDFERAATESKPRALRDIKLQSSQVEWADVGGLRETKAVIRETLEWPTKYAAIFRNCPLRLRSGLLLYGYSGCGKTLLASAVAKECGLHFISVKGPELLNKYIGSSEKSVRDIFARAKAARPCVLFFDEFESIAPKRGHDSTGVTDRVVNQLLTEIDGAEGLEGVYVLAATSRPDLIDSALLRPGRLDKSLLCGMPDEEDRLDILNAISRKLSLDPGVDWTEIAQVTDGYSGADLQALLSNAQLSCVHETIEEEKGMANRGRNDGRGPTALQPLVRNIRILDVDGVAKTPASQGERVALSREVDVILKAYDEDGSEERHGDRGGELTRPQLVIRQDHIRAALISSKPSLPITEKWKLDAIYAQFISGRAAVPVQPTADGVGERVTMM